MPKVMSCHGAMVPVYWKWLLLKYNCWMLLPAWCFFLFVCFTICITLLLPAWLNPVSVQWKSCFFFNVQCSFRFFSHGTDCVTLMKLPTWKWLNLSGFNILFWHFLPEHENEANKTCLMYLLVIFFGCFQLKAHSFYIQSPHKHGFKWLDS